MRISYPMRLYYGKNDSIPFQPTQKTQISKTWGNWKIEIGNGDGCEDGDIDDSVGAY